MTALLGKTGIIELNPREEMIVSGMEKALALASKVLDWEAMRDGNYAHGSPEQRNSIVVELATAMFPYLLAGNVKHPFTDDKVVQDP